MALRLKAGDGDKKAVGALVVLGVSLAGALAFVYTRPADDKWRKRIFGQAVTTLGSTMDAAAEAGMRALANDRALKNLGVRELNLGNLPEGVKIVNLPNQVGGHKMMKSVPALLLLEWAGKGAGGRPARFVLKILHDGGRGLVELGFYDDLARHAEGPGAQGEEPERAELASFLCPYFGAVKVKTDGHTEDDGEVVEPTCMHFLVLQDLCNGLDNPCALDMARRVANEVGVRTLEKKIGQLKKYPNQPMVGFRYVGMSWSSFFEGDQQPEKISMGKSWGAGMAVENTGSGLARFFYDGTRLRRGRVKCALRKVRAVQDFFSRQKIFKFYASSLLLTYDAADPAPPGDEEEEVAVCMIDFAHAVPVDGDGELGEGPAEAPADKGYLYGASNLVGIMEELLEVTAAEPDAPMELDALSAKLKFMTNVKANYVDV
ncbi:unnamed protein product [Scytosiphon promiscuus]